MVARFYDRTRRAGWSEYGLSLSLDRMVVIELVNEAGSSSNGSKQLAKHGAEIVGDIPNYTKIEPKVAHFAAFLGQRKQLVFEALSDEFWGVSRRPGRCEEKPQRLR